MERHVILGGRKIAYELRRSKRAKNISLTVHPDASVALTIPYGRDVFFAESFMIRKGKWLLSKLDFFSRNGCGVKPLGRGDYLKHKESARRLARERADYFGVVYGCRAGKISIRDQKTRWGSCSRKGNLNFNYKIALLPAPIADYVIVHEICHLLEFNHSARFWEMVSRTVPDYKRLRAELKKRSAILVPGKQI